MFTRYVPSSGRGTEATIAAKSDLIQSFNRLSNDPRREQARLLYEKIYSAFGQSENMGKD